MKKTALITGGAKRIGRALVQGLVQDGWAVVIHYHTAQKDAEALADSLPAKPLLLQADLENEQDIRSLVSKAGPLTALINNAAVFEPDDMTTMTAKSWTRHLQINCYAPMILMQDFAAQLPENQTGNIINLLDQRVQSAPTDFSAYTISKAALWKATQIAARAFAPQIRVNAIAPSFVLPHPRQRQSHFDEQVAKTSSGKAISVEEIYDCVRYLLSTPTVTGQLIALPPEQNS